MSLGSLLREHVVKPIQHAQGSPRSVARGAALGMWVALTPTVGIQMFTVGILGIPLRANIPVALALVWLSNPFTMVPLYFLFYWIGSLVLARPGITYAALSERTVVAVETARSEGVWAGLGDLIHVLGWEVAWPMAIGSFIMATAVAVPTYHWVLAWARRRRKQEKAALAVVQDGVPDPVGASASGPSGAPGIEVSEP